MQTTLPNNMTAKQVLDTYFLEARCKLIEVAATLDRVDRGAKRDDIRNDPRLTFIRDALKILESDAPNRAELIELRYSLK